MFLVNSELNKYEVGVGDIIRYSIILPQHILIWTYPVQSAEQPRQEGDIHLGIWIEHLQCQIMEILAKTGDLSPNPEQYVDVWPESHFQLTLV